MGENVMKTKPLHPLSIIARVRVNNEEEQMLIQGRRYIKPTGHEKKQWVYDGILISIHNGLVSFLTTITCLPEDSVIEVLTPVHNFD